MTDCRPSTASTTRHQPRQPRHLVDPVAGRGMPPAGPALRLSRLLDRREPENGLQIALPGARASVQGEWVPFAWIAQRIRSRARSSMTIGILSFTPVRRHVRHRSDARGVRRACVSRALRRGRGGAGPRPGAARHRPGRGRRGDLAGRRRGRRRPGLARSRPAQARDRDGRLSDPAAGAPTRRARRRRPGAICIGARRRRTSWTPPRSCRSATGSR